MLDKRKEHSEISGGETAAHDGAVVPDISFDATSIANNLTKDDLPF